MLQRTEQPATHPGRTQSATFTPKMPVASQTTSPAAPPTHGDPESLPVHAPRERTRLLRSIPSRLAGWFRRHPFLSATALYSVLMGVIAGVVNWSYGQDWRYGYDQIPYNGSGIALIGHCYRVDFPSNTLSILWEIMGCGAYTPGGVECGTLDRAVDIYLNPESVPTFSYDPGKSPFGPGGVTLYTAHVNCFNVDHSIPTGSPSMVPFDFYFLNAFVFVIEKATNRSVPIITFATGEGAENFVVSSSMMQTKNNYTYDPGTGPTTVEVDSGVVFITVKRSRLAQAFTMCLLLVNIALTICSSYITLLVFLRTDKMNEGILLLPVTIVLTIPALRGLFVGSPPFGIYLDTFGFFLQMMTVALCSMVLLYVVARSPAPGRRVLHNDGNT